MALIDHILEFRISIFDAHCHYSSKSLCGFIGLHADFFEIGSLKHKLILNYSSHNSESLIGKVLLQNPVSRLSMDTGITFTILGYNS